MKVKRVTGYVADCEGPDSFREHLGGGWLESVRGGDCYALTDEEGKFKVLPVNRLATILASNLGYPGIAFMPDGTLMRGSDYLVGPVIFYGGAVVRGEDGFETDVTPAVLDAARVLGVVIA